MERNPAVTPEPAPSRTDSAAVWPLVIADVAAGDYRNPGDQRQDVWLRLAADMQARHESGIHKYGVPLQVENGRAPLVDAYQEALDLCAYTRQQYERTKHGGDWFLHREAVQLAVRIRNRMTFLERSEG